MHAVHFTQSKWRFLPGVLMAFTWCLTPVISSAKTLGFVVADIAVTAGEGYDVNCPHGKPLTSQEIYLRYGPITAADRKRLERPENAEGLLALSISGPHGEDLCRWPEAVGFEHPPHRSAVGSTTAPGFDLDRGNHACQHEEFRGSDGSIGIDNQIFRLMACTTYFNTGGWALFANHSLVDGSANYVFEIDGITDVKNDLVEVRFYDSKDVNETDSRGQLLPHRSLRVSEEPIAPKNVFRGRVVNGVLRASDGGELSFATATQHSKHMFTIKNVHLQLELKKDGTVDGLIGGYRDIDNWFEFFMKVGTRAVNVYGLSCPGWIAAAHRLADGYPDPQTGKCTALSVAHRLRAIPAFIIHEQKRGR